MIESIFVLFGTVSVVCIFGGAMIFLLIKGLIGLWLESYSSKKRGKK